MTGAAGGRVWFFLRVDAVLVAEVALPTAAAPSVSHVNPYCTEYSDRYCHSLDTEIMSVRDV